MDFTQKIAKFYFNIELLHQDTDVFDCLDFPYDSG